MQVVAATVPVVSRRYTTHAFFCPSRHTRAMACRSIAWRVEGSGGAGRRDMREGDCEGRGVASQRVRAG